MWEGNGSFFRYTVDGATVIFIFKDNSVWEANVLGYEKSLKSHDLRETYFKAITVARSCGWKV